MRDQKVPLNGNKLPRKPRGRPASTPEGRENQVIAAAVDLAEEQILNGTASSQIITHYLKLASPREQLEREKLINENRLTSARIEAIASGSRTEEMYRDALEAMRSYKGESPDEGPYD